MNLNEENRSLRLLDHCNYESAMSDVEVELSPTKFEPLHDFDPQDCGTIGRTSEDKSISTTRRHISEEISHAIKSYHLRAAMDERRSKSILSVVRFAIAFSLCTLPTILFSLEMIPERCKICLDSVEIKTYFFASAMCGGFGAVLLSHDCSKYLLARFLGGIVGSLGALFTSWMILQTLPPINILNAIFLLVGMVGAMPGFIVYFLVKIVSDECWVSDQRDFEDDFSSLTKLMTEET